MLLVALVLGVVEVDVEDIVSAPMGKQFELDAPLYVVNAEDMFKKIYLFLLIVYAIRNLKFSKQKISFYSDSL